MTPAAISAAPPSAAAPSGRSSSGLLFSAWCVVAAFGAYFCTYGFRKLSDLVRGTGAFEIDQPDGRAMRIRAKAAVPGRTRARRRR